MEFLTKELPKPSHTEYRLSKNVHEDLGTSVVLQFGVYTLIVYRLKPLNTSYKKNSVCKLPHQPTSGSFR